MDLAHLGSGNRICTVVFVDLVGYSKEAVSRQAAIKTRFSELLAEALEHTPAADRLVLDTGDGAALCFLGDPEDALFAANNLRSRLMEASEPHALQLRLGINLGPVRVVKDVAGHPNVIGDGINVAQRVMSFAEPNQILVSRSYYEVVSRLSPEYAQLFEYMGLHRDKHVREHEVYKVQLSPSPGPRGAVEPADAAPASSGAPAPAGEPAGARTVPRFPPALIARLTTALTLEIGPVGKLVVRRAVERVSDARTLCQTLAESVPEASRAAFLKGLADLTAPPAAPGGVSRAPGIAEPRPTGPPAAGPAPPPREIEPELLARAEKLLSHQIGPLARILVRQAAKSAASPRELFERLAIYIDNPEARKIFIEEADRSG
jgi:class 3 adenylate cyclase